ncbi:MAG TPA: alkaline phosphatase family protein, partial [Acidimicrobiia bacterium]
MTVILIVLDGLGARQVTPDLMPTLHGWGSEGLHRQEGAISVLCSSTYPNFGSIVTGALPSQHGIFANEVAVNGSPMPASAVGPSVPTFFDESSEVVVGDQHLIGVMAAHTAGRHWPPSDELPEEGTALDAFGYVADQEVAVRVIAALERQPDFLFVQLNGPDTAAHAYGPDSDEAIESYRSLDRSLADIDGALRSQWDETLLLVTSDHDQETVELSQRVDLGALASERGVEVTVLNEGTAAVVVGPGVENPGWFEGVPGVESSHSVRDDIRLVFSAPEWWFGHPWSPALRGAHGGLRTRSTVAIAAGGHQSLEVVASAFRRPRLG